MAVCVLKSCEDQPSFQKDLQIWNLFKQCRPKLLESLNSTCRWPHDHKVNLKCVPIRTLPIPIFLKP